MLKPIELVSPSFDSPLTDTLLELNHLRKLELGGTTAPWIFFQLKNIFHILESVGSARIEGNRTTVSEYIEQKIESQERSSERFSEIANVEGAMEFIEDNISEGSDITHRFLRELHFLVVNDLEEEGDRTPGSYRSWGVTISGSEHEPMDHFLVQTYMDELVEFLNKKDAEKYDLLKIAIAHHRFAWIHPFGNGNGRVVRLLTYALLIKYGFNVKEGQIINPTAVFCSDRNVYYEKLSLADSGTNEAMLEWCGYVLDGILEEVSKLNKLLDFKYLYKYVLLQTIELGEERGYLNREEILVLSVAIKQQAFKAGDLDKVLKGFTARQRSHLIAKMKDSRLIVPIKKSSRTYCINFTNNFLMRSLMIILEKEGFVPPLDS